MAVILNSSSALKRLTNVVDGPTDYSCVFWFKYNGTPSGGNFVVPFITKKADYSTYYRFKSGVDTIDSQGSVLAPPDPEGLTTAKPIIQGDWYCAAYTRDGTNGHHRLYLQGSGAGNLLFYPITLLEEIWLGSDGIRPASVSIAYFREWDKELGLTALKAELRSPSAVDTVNLITDTPLTSDVLDDSGNGNDWTVVGSAPSFEANPTQEVLSWIEFSIGGTFRASLNQVPNPATPVGPDGSNNGLPLFIIENEAGGLIASINYGSPHAPGSSVTTVAGVVTAVTNTICLVYFQSGVTYQRPVTAFPFTDDQVGSLDGSVPRGNFTWRTWMMRVRTSTFDFLQGDPSNPFASGYSADGEIEVKVDDQVLFSLTNIDLHRPKTNWFTNIIKPFVYPLTDLDSLWICNANVYPTISGPENTPSSPNLQLFTDFNGGNAPGWTDTKLTGTGINGAYYRTDCGLDGTYGASISDHDATTAGLSPSTPYGNLTLTLTLTPPVSGTGTIVVTKVTLPASTHSFDFTAGGGLSPASFSLQDGQSQVFSGLSPGSGYSVAETPDADYVTVEYDVSNDSPINNISVADGEVVTVTVTNKKNGRLIIGKVSDPFSGAKQFSFNAAGGLSPTSFDLASEEDITFADLPAGDSYSVIEVADPDYSPIYLLSNGSTNTNIVIDPGADTVLMILDNFQALFSGIYQIVPDKTNDTVFDEGAEQVEVAIPNPYFETGMIGDL